MNEDITFCSAECERLECDRNKAHIQKDIPHSFAELKGSEHCVADRPVFEKVVRSADGSVTAITDLGLPVNSSYKAILDLDKRLTAAEIPHVTERSNDGWIVIYPSFEHRIGDAIEHLSSYGSRHDLVEVFGFGLKEPVGWLDAEKAFNYFKDAHEKAQEKERKRVGRKKRRSV